MASIVFAHEVGSKMHDPRQALLDIMQYKYRVEFTPKYGDMTYLDFFNWLGENTTDIVLIGSANSQTLFLNYNDDNLNFNLNMNWGTATNKWGDKVMRVFVKDKIPSRWDPNVLEQKWILQ